jgi:hypothetical protein
VRTAYSGFKLGALDGPSSRTFSVHEKGLVQQVPTGAKCDDVDAILGPGNRSWSVSDASADRLPASPTQSVPRSVLQRIVVALPEEVEPT